MMYGESPIKTMEKLSRPPPMSEPKNASPWFAERKLRSAWSDSTLTPEPEDGKELVDDDETEGHEDFPLNGFGFSKCGRSA